MNTKNVILTIGFIFSLLLASCNIPTAAGAGPRAWIDKPLNGSTLPLGPVVVISHAASDSGTTSVTLLVNGAQVRTDNATDPSNPLVEISQVWLPNAPGDYMLQVIAVDSQGDEGNSSMVRVRIGGESTSPAPSQGGQSPEPSVTAETVPPTALQSTPRQPTETLTPVQACQVPTFTFSMNANCREGPGTAYEVDNSFFQGQSAQIDGRNDKSPRWWWVVSSGGSHCWVSDSTGSASCLIADVPIIAAPPLPTVIVPTDTSAPPPPPPPPSKPTAPANFSVTTITCDSSNFVVGLTWSDSKREDGYRVYRDGAMIATLPAGTTSYNDDPPNYNAHNYYVEAFNSSGSANGPTVSSTVCFY